MSTENELAAREAELAGLLQQTLRRETPPGLSDAQRALLVAATYAPKPRWITRGGAFFAAAACAALLWVLHVDQQERAGIERAAQRAQAAQQRAQLEGEAQRVAREATLAAERERVMAAQRAAELARESVCRTRQAVAAESGEAPSHRSRGSHAAGASAPGKTGAAGHSVEQNKASGSCDVNDPLCGL